MTQERRLGRGLEALLGRPVRGGDESSAGANATAAGVTTLGLHLLDSNPYQPRQEFDAEEIQALADSLSEHGLLQPILVRQVNERYQIIAGERRVRAARLAGWTEAPANVQVVDDRRMAEIAIVENLQRKDLGPLEKAASFQQYLQRYECTQEELAGRLKINRSTVANLIRLLELPEAVQKMIREGKISQGHARALLPLGEEKEQISFAKKIHKEGLSVRATEALVQDTIRRVDAEPLMVVGEDDPALRMRRENLTSLEQQFRTALGTKVDVKQSAGGKGRIVIHFSNHEEFERIQQQLQESAGQLIAQAG